MLIFRKSKTQDNLWPQHYCYRNKFKIEWQLILTCVSFKFYFHMIRLLFYSIHMLHMICIINNHINYIHIPFSAKNIWCFLQFYIYKQIADSIELFHFLTWNFWEILGRKSHNIFLWILNFEVLENSLWLRLLWFRKLFFEQK